jgi:hypothetical protein
MRARGTAETFERAWTAQEHGALPIATEAHVAELVALAMGLGSLADPPQTPSTAPAWARLSTELDRSVVPLRRGVTVSPVRSYGAYRLHRRGTVLRWVSTAAALFIAFAMVALHAEPGSTLYPLRTSLEQTALFVSPDDGAIHLRIAEARLGDLLHALRQGPQSDAPSLARALVAQRHAAAASGQNVSTLDVQIQTQVPPALPDTPLAIARLVVSILQLDVILPSPPAPSTGASSPATSSDEQPTTDSQTTVGQADTTLHGGKATRGGNGSTTGDHSEAQATGSSNGTDEIWNLKDAITSEGSDTGSGHGTKEHGADSSNVSNTNSNGVSEGQGPGSLKKGDTPPPTPSPTATGIPAGPDGSNGKAKGHLKNNKADQTD